MVYLIIVVGILVFILYRVFDRKLDKERDVFQDVNKAIELLNDNEYWHYIVRQDYTDEVGKGGHYYKHEDKAEALRRASRYMDLSLENLCSDYRMGKLPDGLPHKIILRLYYAESADGGLTYNEVILEEKRLLEFLGLLPKHY